jgi:hypothetical protein
MVVMVVVVVMMVMVVMILMMMVIIVSELHVGVGSRPAMATSGNGRSSIGDPQKRGSIGNGIEQFAE